MKQTNPGTKWARGVQLNETKKCSYQNCWLVIRNLPLSSERENVEKI